MLTDELDIDKEYKLKVNAKAKGINNNFKVTAEIFYGEKRTRYYYEKPDKIYSIDIIDSADYTAFSKAIKFEKAVDFVMIKISAIDFNGSASVFTPKLI